MTYSNFVSPGVSLQGGGGSGSGTASLPISGNGATVTASTPLINGTQTWNNGATTFTSLLLNVTDTASAAASLLMDLQVGGTSRLKVGKGGALSFNNERTGLEPYANGLIMTANGSFPFFYDASSFRASSTASIGWTSQSTGYGTVSDTFLTRRGAANLRLGAADAAAPVPQTLSVQSVVAGTSNTAGANLTITGSQGTGTGAGGSIIFQVAPAGGSGTTQNALATALTIASTTDVTFAANAIITGTFFLNTSLTGSDYFFGSNFYARSNVRLASGIPLGWSSSATAPNAAADLTLFRDAANTLALRNGASAQTFNVYNTFTDASNYERGKIAWSSNVLQIGTEKAGTGTARALEFQTDGTTRLTIATSGIATFTNSILATGDVRAGSASYFYWSSRSQISSPSNGNILLQNFAANDFSLLQFGGTTSSFPALKRNGAMLETRLADDSGFAAHGAEWISVTDGVTAPAAVSGRARIYVDTADGDLKIIFGDGTVKTIVTDT